VHRSACGVHGSCTRGHLLGGSGPWIEGPEHLSPLRGEGLEGLGLDVPFDLGFQPRFERGETLALRTFKGAEDLHHNVGEVLEYWGSVRLPDWIIIVTHGKFKDPSGNNST